MKEIKIDEKKALEEQLLKEAKEAEQKAHDEEMERFRGSKARTYILEYFEKAEKRITDQLEEMQLRDMRSVFMLSHQKQLEKIEEMSKRDAILSGVLSIIKQVKSKL